MGNINITRRQTPKRFGVSLHVFTLADCVRAFEDNNETNVRVQIGRGLRAPDVEALAKALETNSSVRVLYLNKNKITSVKPLADALRVNETLVKLDLHGNLVSDAASVFNALEENESLQELYLHDNRITDVTGLGPALRINRSLKELDLQSNQITCVDGVGEGLKYNRNLKRLRLQGNQICDVTSLSEGIALNRSLKDLRLSGNAITNVAVTTFGECLQENHTLLRLELYSNPLDLPRCVWKVRPWRRCGPIIDLCTVLKELKDMRRDYHSFSITVASNLPTVCDRPHTCNTRAGLMDIDGLVLAKISDFLWHSISIDSRLSGLVESLMVSHDSSWASRRTPSSSLDLLQWLLKRKGELEGRT